MFSYRYRTTAYPSFLLISSKFGSPRRGEYFKRMNRLNNNEDICARRHKGNAESVEAFASISPEALSAQEQKVYSCSCQYTGGLTGDEIAGILQMPHQSVSARLSGLQKKDGIVRRPLFPLPPKAPFYVRRRTASGALRRIRSRFSAIRMLPLAIFPALISARNCPKEPFFMCAPLKAEKPSSHVRSESGRPREAISRLYHSRVISIWRSRLWPSAWRLEENRVYEKAFGVGVIPDTFRWFPRGYGPYL